MPYRLRMGTDLGSELRRIAGEQASRGQANLAVGRAHAAQAADLQEEDAWDEAVHDVRKRCKKVRAVARLCRDTLDEGYQEANRAFRDTARLVAVQRDAWTLVETVTAMASRDASTLPDGDSAQDLEEVHAALVDRYADIRATAVDDDLLAEVEVALEDAAAGIEGWPLPVDLAADDLAESIHRVHHRGREGYLALRDTIGEDPDDAGADWHDWRKRVKYLWYQARLLEEAWPDPMAALADELDYLGDMLGEDHDLMVLVEVLREERLADPAVIEQVAGTAAARRQAMRRGAADLAARVYAEDSDAFTDRMLAYLAAAGW